MLQRLTRVDLSGWYASVSILLTYAALPLVLGLLLVNADHYFELAIIATLAAFGILVGSKLPIFDPLFLGRGPRIAVGEDGFYMMLWGGFFCFALLAWVTAEKIPLLAALSGADSDTIAYLRERFLKAREGWQSSFVYINALLTGAMLPYSIARMFVRGTRYRWIAFLFFLFYCISFVEKAFFLKAALPLLYLVLQRKVKLAISPTKLISAMAGVLLLVTFLSGAGHNEVDGDEAFFSVAHAPNGALGHLLWRSVAIPVVTAGDAIRVFHDEFGSRPLWGATSTLFAGIFGLERVEFERMVFAAEWGQNETETGSSNSVFFTEAYVNFGTVGVLLFSIATGLMFRMFSKSKDAGFQSLWILFCMGIYTSGLIGLLLSNGFILLFFVNLFIKLVPHREMTSLPHESSVLHPTRN